MNRRRGSFASSIAPEQRLDNSLTHIASNFSTNLGAWDGSQSLLNEYASYNYRQLNIPPVPKREHPVPGGTSLE